MSLLFSGFGSKTSLIHPSANDQCLRAQVQLSTPWRLTMVAFDAYYPTYPYPLGTDTLRPIHWRAVALLGTVNDVCLITPGSDTLVAQAQVTKRIYDGVSDPNRPIIVTWPDILSSPIFQAGDVFTAALGPVILADGTIGANGYGSITVWGQPIDDAALKNLRLR